MTTVLFLTYRMKLGYGVDVVVREISRRLVREGMRVVIGCLEQEPGFDGLEIVTVHPRVEALKALAKRVSASVVVAHTTPFFELLPQLGDVATCWAYEHGDPTPALFDADRSERERICDHKRVIYPKLSGVIAISEFIRNDIGFPAARVVYNGADHVPETEAKGHGELLVGERRPLRIGTLMRLGSGEAHYKGNSLFRQFAAALRTSKSKVELCVMGRGTTEDADPFRANGIRVHLNAPDSGKWEYLRNLDVFVSFSLWEGFNLPLAEAQALGTVGLALDTGAHPEVTPFVMGNLHEALAQVRTYEKNRELLLADSQKSHRFARRFSWDLTAANFMHAVNTANFSAPRP